ncbi:hypothetical protein L7F22_025449 [Adiantum nelumboides]|nr:hypothetical protein [Adiantum nelumboides]
MDARAAKKVEGPQQRKRNEVIMAAYQVVFEYLCHLVCEKKLTRLPDHSREKELYKVYSKKDVVAQFKKTTIKKNDVEQEKVDSSPPKDQVNQTTIFQGGCCPPMFLEESSSHFHKLQIDPLSDLWAHFLLEGNILTKPSFSTTWRGGLQRSPMFLLCVLELLCPPSRLVLEMGCGTAPLMRASKASSCPCFSFDIDETIVNAIVQPLVQELSSKRACLDAEESLELDDYQV